MDALFDRFRDKKQFGSLDGIRALSILGVVWHHTRIGEHPLFAQRGFLGVDLFFTISGFLIVTLLLRERERTGRISLRGFYARRVLRIFPLYYAVLLGCAAIAVASSSAEALRLREDLPYAFSYLSNWVPTSSLLSITWSLSAEEQFYLVWPALMIVAGRRVIFVLVLALAACASLMLLHGPLALELPEFIWQTSFFPILLGVLLAHLLHGRRSFLLLARVLAWRGAPLVTGAVVLGLMAGLDADLQGLPRISIHLAMLAFLASCVMREDHLAARVLRFAPLARIGVLSYGIYLLHMFARHAAAMMVRPLEHHGDFVHGTAFFLVTLALSIVAAELSYRFFESRFLKLKELFAPAHPERATNGVSLRTLE